METKEKNFEQDIESWLLTEGGYVKANILTETRQFFYSTEKCKILLTCCILNMLGLTNKEINLCCENSPISQIIDSLPFEPETE